MSTIYTVGHGTRSREVVIAAANNMLLIDVRSKPFSRWCAACNKNAMAKALVGRYLSMPELGGFGDADPIERQAAIEQVRQIIKSEDVVLMCSESDPARCHRSALAVEIAAGRHEIVHLLVPEKKNRVGKKRTSQLTLSKVR